jgi:hypothetical protein
MLNIQLKFFRKNENIWSRFLALAMRLFLQINIGEWKKDNYVKPLLSFASSLADDVIGTDVDNRSEGHIIDLVKKLIAQSTQAFLYVCVTEQQPLNHLLSLINYIFQHKDKIHLVVFTGEHATAEKLFRALNEKFIKNSEDDLIRKMIKQFVRG